jgi:AcrB/AcrD/AcrF family
VVPLALAIIFGMLLWMFQDARLSLSVFAVVPFALTGGMLGLLARGLSFSIPAAVGFIALAGVAVLNGVALANEVRAKLASGWPLAQAWLLTDGVGDRRGCGSAAAARDRGGEWHRDLHVAHHVHLAGPAAAVLAEDARVTRASDAAARAGDSSDTWFVGAQPPVRSRSGDFGG